MLCWAITSTRRILSSQCEEGGENDEYESLSSHPSRHPPAHQACLPAHETLSRAMSCPPGSPLRASVRRKDPVVPHHLHQIGHLLARISLPLCLLAAAWGVESGREQCWGMAPGWMQVHRGWPPQALEPWEQPGTLPTVPHPS